MTKTFTQLEGEHQDFYVPAYQILVNGQDLLAKLHMEISSVEVDESLKGADRFSFTVNGMFDFRSHEFKTDELNLLTDVFAHGSPVLIHMGYKDSGKLPLMIHGIITSVQTSFPASGLPQLNVSGYDLSHCLTVGTAAAPLHFTDMKDSEMVAKVASQYGLIPVVKETPDKHPITKKGQDSDMQFLDKLTKRNRDYELHSKSTEKGVELHFRPPDYNAEAALALEWGSGLISFSPEVNIAEQVSRVEVRSWDVKAKKEIVTAAELKEGLGCGLGQQIGGEMLEPLCLKKRVLQIRESVFSKKEASDRAYSTLKERSERFMTGTGESIGLPEIRPDQRIKLLGLGELFTKCYYVEQSTHRINSSGYKTTFKVRLPFKIKEASA